MNRDASSSAVDAGEPFDLKPPATARPPRVAAPVYGNVTPQFFDDPPSIALDHAGGVAVRHSSRWQRRIVCAALLIGMVCVTAVLGHLGYVLRGSLYASFPMMRHHGDINNAFNQGTAVNDVARALAAQDGITDLTPSLPYLYRGWVERVDRAYDAGRASGQFELDYVPLRLLIPAFWARGARAADPNATSWQEGLDFTAFMLNVNTAMGALAALGMFLLVRHWVLRRALPTAPSLLGDPAPPPTVRAWALGWTAAMLVWFEPNILLEAHVWPQWDLWIVPSYLFAVWLASTGRWFTAGLLLGVGVMLKGQLLFGLPVLLMWPLFDLRVGAAARLVTGFACAFVAVASPWLLQTSQAVQYVALVAVGGMVLMALRLTQSRAALAIGAVLAGAAIVVPMLLSDAPAGPTPPLWALGLLLALLVAAIAWRGRSSALPVAVAGGVAGGAVLGALAFEGTWSWFHIGFGFGTHRYQSMYMGPSVSNLSALLHDVSGWNLQDAVTTLAAPAWLLALLPENNRAGGQLVVTIKLLQTSLFLIALPLCAWAAARHARRNDPRLLVAITAPWVIFFAVMPQMHERYLFWGAVVAVTGAGVSMGMTLLWAVVSSLSFSMILHCQILGDPALFGNHPQFVQTFIGSARKILIPAHPGLGWMTLLLASIYLYVAVTPSRARVR